MAKPRARYNYTETRLNLDQAYAGSTVELAIPESSHYNALQPKRTILSSSSSGTDEASFLRDNLALDCSIFFRHENRYPRSFLWRLLDERKVLEIQSVDLTQDAGEKVEALLTLRLRFPSSIRPYCLAFADPEVKDALTVYAITATNELYTITLQKDLFVHLKSSETLPTDWCRIFAPPALRVREPFRLTSINAEELFVSLSDGALLKLDQKSHENTNLWRETYFSAPGWNLSLPRAIAKWKGNNYVKYGDIDLDPSSALSVAISPDEETIITVCLNHTLRIFNAKNGRIAMQADLTEPDEHKLQNQPKFLIGPNQKQLLQVLDVPGRDGDQFYIVTFSPKQHEFTFWAVLDTESGVEGVRRVQTDIRFVPPIDDLMETSAWTLEEFNIQANNGWSKTRLWLRARSGPISRVFTVEFDLFGDEDTLEHSWYNEWDAVNAGRQATEYLNDAAPPEFEEGSIGLQSPSVTNKWLDFLFYPGRFTLPTLETALHVYSKGPNPTSRSTHLAIKGPLKERIAQAVSKKASFSLLGADVEEREIKFSEEWQVFYGLVQDLHKRRATAMSFTFDDHDRLPWIVSADFVSPVRLCKALDICDFHRSPERNDVAEEQAVKSVNASYEMLDLLYVSYMFCNSLPPMFIDNLKRVLLPELLSDPSSSIADRMVSLHDQAEFSTYINDEDWERLHEVMNDSGEYNVLDSENFEAILSQLEEERAGRRGNEQTTRYGARALIRTSQENLYLYTKTLVDLLIVVIFVETEIDRKDLEDGMRPKIWKGQDLYVAILDKLREQAVLDFLMRNLRTETTSKRSRRLSVGDSPTTLRSSTSERSPSYTITLMESLFIGDWAAIHVPADMELPELISYWSRRWTCGLELNSQIENFTAHVLADMIKHGEDALASEFAQYVPNTGWSTYLKGRLQLLLGDYDQAALNFKKAAYAISLTNISEIDTANLLRPDEKSNFSRGIVGYLEHIMNLYDSLKSFTYVVDFAQSALQYQESHPPPSKKTKSSQTILPPTSQANLLSRLFTAAVDSTQYDVAYSILTRITNPALRKSSLQQFIDALMRARQASRLLAYPFATLATELDAELAHKARTALNVVAANSLGYHRVLYARRIQTGDFRGAAQCLWEYLARLKSASESVMDPRDESLVQAYLMVINALACCGEDDGWVLDESGDTAGSPGFGGMNGSGKTVRFENARSSTATDTGPTVPSSKKRRLVFLEDVRVEYQALLDRMAALEEGKFAFGGSDGMEVDVL
ncbi:hypothetical protein BT63DRAFT_441495 [Microthyrium microscopicum]|uniref:Nucleoporin Nup120/160 n=1 Tax=Microthyrium microscopicum TaxID=703497 RepID=A0A6A6U9H7_9PEZI|nr:hypothetical protein BT63DRAFT_441495 [Microthyrium microscopicum]